MFTSILYAIIIILIGILYRLNKDYHILSFCRRFKRVDGTSIYGVYPGVTIFGNNYDFYDCNRAIDLFKTIRIMTKNAKRMYFQYFVGNPTANIINVEDTEIVFNSTSLIKKGVTYPMFQQFVQEGLLTSEGTKWHQRRKLLTPTFHFSILQRFMETFKDETEKFLKLLEEDKSDILDLTKAIPRFTLNNICETALGIDLDNIKESDEYRKNIVQIEHNFIKRICNPLYHIDFIFYLTPLSKKLTKIIKQLHNFSSKIINRKRINFKNKNNKLENEITDSEDDDIYYFKKKRHAMLDTLLEAEKNSLIDHQGICEEVDTFMLEGFDTTSSGLIFSIMCLALHPDVQNKCYEEILLQFPENLSTLTLTHLNSLKYLDCAIKESLRLYPPVPFISRMCEEEIVYGDYIFPKNTTINIHIFDIHRDPHHFKNPDVYDPNRFLPENTIDMHPFCFIPFSAGSRNCIGQKFAMAEMKILIVYLIKNYEILPLTKSEDIVFESGLVLRSKDPIKVRLVPRERKNEI